MSLLEIAFLSLGEEGHNKGFQSATVQPRAAPPAQGFGERSYDSYNPKNTDAKNTARAKAQSLNLVMPLC